MSELPITYKRHHVHQGEPISGAFIIIFDSFAYRKEKGKGTTRKEKKFFYMIMNRTHQGPEDGYLYPKNFQKSIYPCIHLSILQMSSTK